MRIPKNVIILGFVESISYQKSKSRTVTTMDFHAKSLEYLLATNKPNTHLYIFENNSTGKVEIIRDKSGIQSGFMHHIVRYEIPKLELKPIGQAINIFYRSNVLTGKLQEFRHDFHDCAIYADSYSRIKTFGIKPKKGKIFGDQGITQ